MNNNNNYSGGLGFCAVLAIVFIILKLVDKIDWSWWWVLAPIWIPIAFSFLIAIVITILHRR